MGQVPRPARDPDVAPQLVTDENIRPTSIHEHSENGLVVQGPPMRLISELDQPGKIVLKAAQSRDQVSLVLR